MCIRVLLAYTPHDTHNPPLTIGSVQNNLLQDAQRRRISMKGKFPFYSCYFPPCLQGQFFFFVACRDMCFLHPLSSCALRTCKVNCINLSLFTMHSRKITMRVGPRRFQKPDGFISHSAALLRFTTAAP